MEPFRGAYSKIFDESLKTLPSVATLRISLNSSSNVLDDLIKRTPNVKTMSIAVSYDDSLDYSYVFSPLPIVNYKNISIYLPKLENLRWHFFFEEHKVDYQLDALITGLPQHLWYALAKKLRYIDHLPEDEIQNYWEPCNPSLLDLKGKIEGRNTASRSYFIFCLCFHRIKDSSLCFGKEFPLQ